MPQERGSMLESENGWKQLCEQASKEEDPQRLLELTGQINELLIGRRGPKQVPTT